VFRTTAAAAARSRNGGVAGARVMPVIQGTGISVPRAASAWDTLPGSIIHSWMGTPGKIDPGSSKSR